MLCSCVLKSSSEMLSSGEIRDPAYMFRSSAASLVIAEAMRRRLCTLRYCQMTICSCISRALDNEQQQPGFGEPSADLTTALLQSVSASAFARPHLRTLLGSGSLFALFLIIYAADPALRGYDVVVG